MRSIIEIGRIIAEERMKKGYSQEDLAELIGCQPNSISRWENGETTMKIDVLQKIATALDVSADKILGLSIQRDEEKYLFEYIMTDKEKMMIKKSIDLLYRIAHNLIE